MLCAMPFSTMQQCMYACTYVCVYVCTEEEVDDVMRYAILKYVFMCVCMYVYVYVCMYTRYKCLLKKRWTTSCAMPCSVCTSVCMYVSRYVCVYACMYTRCKWLPNNLIRYTVAGTQT
jgi:hypothetical protein